MAPHSMATHGMPQVVASDHMTQHDQFHTSNHVKHHNPNQHAQIHICCDDGHEVCSTSSACATHCAASFTQRALKLCPVITIIDFEAVAVFLEPASLDLDGPFKPPR